MMDDDLHALRAALKSAPGPAPEARARAMAQAMENFDRMPRPAQGSASDLRPNQDRPVRAGLLGGVIAMLKSKSSRPWLAGTASAAALCVGLVVLLPQMQRGPQTPAQPPVAERKATADSTLAAPAPVAETTAETAPPEPRAELEAPADIAVTEAAPMQSQAEPPMVAARRSMGVAPATGGLAADGMAAGGMAADALLAAPMPAPYVGEAEAMPFAPENTEAFANAEANPVKITAEEPVSTFSIDVDTASWAMIRSSLEAGFLPDPDSVRVEEMVNYFPYAYPAPEAGQAFRPTVTVTATPWNPDTRLVHVAIQGELPAATDRPPLNLVLLIDTSGSMQDANKLPLLKRSLALMLPQLRTEDQVAIVAYAGSAGQVLAPTPASDRATILAALDRLEAGGSTAGAEGIALAYQTAEAMAAPGEIGRVLLATDGDFNVGIDSPEALETFIADKRRSGTYLSVLGFGRGNLDDATMQALAQTGNGTAAYIDSLSEARKVLVDQFSGALFPIADDVKIQVEWNPATVAEYRLIGYETRALRREDFNNDKVDAGEIGAGTAVTAIYEVTAPGSPALLNDALRYGAAGAGAPTAAPTMAENAELGFLRLRWKAPGAAQSQLIEQPIPAGIDAGSDDVRFATAIAGFGQLLRGSVYLGDWGWDDAITLANGARGDDPFGYRGDAVTLMRLAEALSQ